MANKINVNYVCGSIGEPGKNQQWGGNMATNYCLKKAFSKSSKYKLNLKIRSEFNSIQEVKAFLDKGDISFLDETTLLAEMFNCGYDRPDLIGPITRSPVKSYNNGTWTTSYTPEWFYNGPVIRLNENEEKPSTLRDEFKNGINYEDKITFIRHGVDIDLLKPNKDKEKKYILWAGNANREAKNYQMWIDIKNILQADNRVPLNVEFRQMSGYSIDKFWDVLDETLVYVNTSFYESYCNAVNEARAKGVPTIVKDFFNGQVMFIEQPIQVHYNPVDYANKIIDLITNKKYLESEQIKAREYEEKNSNLDIMRKDIEKVLDKISKAKGLNK